MIISVSCHDQSIVWDDYKYQCRIGQGGYIDEKQGVEGDGKTPLGQYNVRFGLYRPDRLPFRPPSRLHMWPLSPQDGWCDDVKSGAYNRFVRLPFSGSHEKLWRDDGVYDIILVMDHNDSPPQKGAGSAVFIHIAQTDDRQTLGCVALTPDVMVALLRDLEPGMDFRITS